MKDVIDVQAREVPEQSAAQPSCAQAPEAAPAASTPAAGAQPENIALWGWVSYALHLVTAVAVVVPGMQPAIGLLLLALGIDIFLRDDARGTWQEGHFRWRIRSVVWAGVWYAVTSPLFLLLIIPGLVAWSIVSLWFLYRIVRGVICMVDNQPMGV